MHRVREAAIKSYLSGEFRSAVGQRNSSDAPPPSAISGHGARSLKLTNDTKRPWLSINDNEAVCRFTRLFFFKKKVQIPEASFCNTPASPKILAWGTLL